MKKLFFVLALFAAQFSFAQYASNGTSTPMTALQSGDIRNVANVKSVNIIFDYKDMGVGAYRAEADYVNKRYTDLEAKEKGKGEKFKQAWEDAKTKRYPEHFVEMFNKTAEKALGMNGTYNTTNADYNLVVKVTFIEPGMNIGIAKKPAYVDMECTFTDKSGKELVRYFVKNAVGSQVMGYDFDTASRVVESYGKAAKMLVKKMQKDRKKAK